MEPKLLSLFCKPKVQVAVDQIKKQLPIRQFVQLAWRFVSQSYPIIVCLPEEFDEKLHSVSIEHWDEKAEFQRLIYARPVVYRSFHGNIIRKGLVGNM